MSTHFPILKINNLLIINPAQRCIMLTNKINLKPRLIDWITTVPFLLSFIFILLTFELIQRFASLFGKRAHEISAGLLQSSLVSVLKIFSGVKLEIKRSADVKANTPYLFISNHQSMFDIPIIGSILFSNFPKYVSKKSLAKGIPSISYNLRNGGSALIDRDDREQAQEEIVNLGKRVQKRGVSAVIYPEGTRAREGVLKQFKPGGTLSLLEAAPEVEVVPITIDNSWKILMYNLKPVPFGINIKVHIGSPMKRTESKDGMYYINKSEDFIKETLKQWRGV